jgi:hypothetical protein
MLASARTGMMMRPADVETAGSRWKGLYRAGATAALITLALILVAIVAHVAWPPPDWSPGSAGEWFTRLQDNWLLGLLGLDLSIIISLVVGIPLFLALYVALRRSGESAMAIATAFALIGAMLHLVSNTAFEMLSLSGAYAAATTDAQRAVFLAAGEATLAAYKGTAFHVSYILGYAAKIIIGVVMLRGPVFGKATACIGVLAGLLGLGLYVLPAIGILLSLLSVVLIGVWYALVARTLFRLG